MRYLIEVKIMHNKFATHSIACEDVHNWLASKGEEVSASVRRREQQLQSYLEATYKKVGKIKDWSMEEDTPKKKVSHTTAVASVTKALLK